MFALSNPSSNASNAGQSTYIGGFQSLVFNRHFAKITDSTERMVEFELSDDVELLEVSLSWTDEDNPKNLSDTDLNFKYLDADGEVIPGSDRRVMLPFSPSPRTRIYYIPALTPSEAKKAVFYCSYIDITVSFVSRAVFKEPQQ